MLLDLSSALVDEIMIYTLEQTGLLFFMGFAYMGDASIPYMAFSAVTSHQRNTLSILACVAGDCGGCGGSR